MEFCKKCRSKLFLFLLGNLHPIYTTKLPLEKKKSLKGESKEGRVVIESESGGVKLRHFNSRFGEGEQKPLHGRLGIDVKLRLRLNVTVKLLCI